MTKNKYEVHTVHFVPRHFEVNYKADGTYVVRDLGLEFDDSTDTFVNCITQLKTDEQGKSIREELYELDFAALEQSLRPDLEVVVPGQAYTAYGFHYYPSNGSKVVETDTPEEAAELAIEAHDGGDNELDDYIAGEIIYKVAHFVFVPESASEIMSEAMVGLEFGAKPSPVKAPCPKF
jgi:hypothetical protein